MAELQKIVTSLGHADVTTYIQSGNVLFTPRSADTRTAGGTATLAINAAGPATDSAALATDLTLAAELERAIADRTGMQARAVVLSREELARCVLDNPYPGETNHRLLHAIFLPEVPGPGLSAWVADAERQVQANGSRDRAHLFGRTVYLHTPDGYPRSDLRRVLARAGGPTSARLAGTARNWATVSRLLELCAP